MEPKLSLLIPTCQNPWYLDTAVRSAVKHAEPGAVEVVVFSNCHNDETETVLDVLQEYGLPVRAAGKSAANEGVCLATNACAESARGDFFLYANDDFYFLPGWDKALLARAPKPGEYRYTTPRTMEPTGANPQMYAPCPFGTGPKDFRENAVLAFWGGLKKQDVVSTASPAFAPRWLWEEVGGFDIGYFPGFSHDPDFAMKVASAALAHGQEPVFLGLGDVGIYHMACQTTNRVRSQGASMAARIRFKDKWGFATDDFLKRTGDGTPL